MNYISVKLVADDGHRAFNIGFKYKINLVFPVGDSNRYTSGTARNRTYQIEDMKIAMRAEFGSPFNGKSRSPDDIFWSANPYVQHIIYVKDLDKFNEFYIEYKLKTG